MDAYTGLRILKGIRILILFVGFQDANNKKKLFSFKVFCVFLIVGTLTSVLKEVTEP